MLLGDAPPVVHAGAAERIDAHADLRVADQRKVDDVAEVGDVRAEVVVPVRRRRAQRLRAGKSPDAGERGLEKGVGRSLDPARDIGARGTTVGGVVLEAAVSRRVVRRRHDDAVGQPRGAAAVVGEDGVRHGRRRREFVVHRQHHFHAVGGQHFECAGRRRARERVGIDAEKERPVDALLQPIAADRLRDREHVPFIEGDLERRAAVAGRAEGNALRCERGIGNLGVVSRDELRHVDERGLRSRLAGERADPGRHGRAALRRIVRRAA